MTAQELTDNTQDRLNLEDTRPTSRLVGCRSLRVRKKPSINLSSPPPLSAP